VPLYQYQCTKGHSYEKQQPFGSPVEHPCEQPRCKATAKRVLIAPQVHFKGSGWYKTDSRGSGSTRRGSSSSSSDSDSSSTSSESSSSSSESSVGAKTSDDT
jgi:putative FmdB family regulatory protein